MDRYIVTKCRKSDYPNPISVKEGDSVFCVKSSEDQSEWSDWIFCRANEQEGWIPKQILQEQKGIGHILEDYCAEEFDLIVGEILCAKKSMNGWLWCYKELNPDKLAWAPLNCMKKIAL